MGEPQGARLYVNLPASQVRRRLKGLGHGVRKVHSGGRHRAVIIHTATGRHLETLQAVFADVGWATREVDLGEPLEELRNLGPTSAAWLRDVGLATREQLAQVGPLVAYRRVQQRYPRTSLNLLWALVAGLEDRDWRTLDDDEKQRWRRLLNDL